MDESQYIHLIGKDILRFHTIYWPIMLHALDVELPKQIFGHPWLLSGTDKMSKSKGNIVYADDLVNEFGVDAVRFYLLHEMPFASDGFFTRELLIDSINSNLANVLGNLVNRTIGMIDKYFDGVVTNQSIKENIDEEFISFVLEASVKVTNKMNELRVADAIDEVFEVFRRCNKYIDETMPWVLAKDDSKKDRLATVLYNLVEGIRIGTVLLQPFMPETSEKIFKQINTSLTDFESLAKFGGYKSGTEVKDREVYFKE